MLKYDLGIVGVGRGWGDTQSDNSFNPLNEYCKPLPLKCDRLGKVSGRNATTSVFAKSHESSNLELALRQCAHDKFVEVQSLTPCLVTI